MDRCEKISMSAMKQSLKAYLPVINPLIKFDKFIMKNYAIDAKSIGYLGIEESIFISDFHRGKQSHLICIGPEGDFTHDEIQLATQNGFKCISLGKSRLRTETAGVVVSAIINTL
jgi:16S rRNA (uracil1498-N3)-methyltransferase